MPCIQVLHDLTERRRELSLGSVGAMPVPAARAVWNLCPTGQARLRPSDAPPDLFG